MKRIFLYLLLLLLVPSLSFCQYTAGTSYFDSNSYIEYIAGNLPIIISSPHGGYLEPSAIPDRNCTGCSYVRDSYTQELTRELKDAIYNKTGCYPHVVMNLLHRKKLDANRAIGDAADGNIDGENAWAAYHQFIDTSKHQVNSSTAKGVYLDIHGHAHAIQRLELGYLLSKTTLQSSDAAINVITASSIKNLANSNLSAHTHSELVRGANSFGTLCEIKGYPSVPSLSTPFPLSTESYFSGGYNTVRHGSSNGGVIDGIQIECNSNLRFNAADRQGFADSLANVILQYLDLHYLTNLSPNYCLPTSINTIEEAAVKLFPNPADDNLNIESLYYPLQVSVYNNIGQLLMNTSVYSSSDRIDLSALNCGLLFVFLQHEIMDIPIQKVFKTCR
jgi:hypothetical protein